MTMSHQVNEDVSQAPQRTRPEPPSGCLPGLLIVAGPIVGLMVACGGVVSSLTPPEPTVRFDQAARLQAPANLRMAISWMSPGSPNCTVQGPEGTYDVRKERRAGTSEFDAVFTTRSSGVYEIECAEVARTGEYEVTNPDAADPSASEQRNLHDGKMLGGIFAGGLIGAGLVTAVVGRRRHEKELAAYEARTERHSD